MVVGGPEGAGVVLALVPGVGDGAEFGDEAEGGEAVGGEGEGEGAGVVGEGGDADACALGEGVGGGDHGGEEGGVGEGFAGHGGETRGGCGWARVGPDRGHGR